MSAGNEKVKLTEMEVGKQHSEIRGKRFQQ